MKKGLLIFLLGLFAAAAAFAGIYFFGTLHCRSMMRETKPELAWLKKEFGLTDAEFTRVSQLHEAYLPLCRERCKRIQQQDAKLRELLARSKTVTPEIQNLLAERARTRSECEAEMLAHFLEVSRTMPPKQGERYLAWVEKQTSLRGQGMQERHDMADEPHM
jgi:hypothetical protein